MSSNERESHGRSMSREPVEKWPGPSGQRNLTANTMVKIAVPDANENGMLIWLEPTQMDQ